MPNQISQIMIRHDSDPTKISFHCCIQDVYKTPSKWSKLFNFYNLPLKTHEFLDRWCYNCKFRQCIIWYCSWLCYNRPSGSKIEWQSSLMVCLHWFILGDDFFSNWRFDIWMDWQKENFDFIFTFGYHWLGFDC